MRLYVAICTTFDSESDCSCNDKTIVGIFSTKKEAEDSFTKEVQHSGHSGDSGWTQHHICFQGKHNVIETDLDNWTPLGIY